MKAPKVVEKKPEKKVEKKVEPKELPKRSTRSGPALSPPASISPKVKVSAPVSKPHSKKKEEPKSVSAPRHPKVDSTKGPSAIISKSKTVKLATPEVEPPRSRGRPPLADKETNKVPKQEEQPKKSLLKQPAPPAKPEEPKIRPGRPA